MENFLLSTTQPVKNYLIQFFSFGFDFASKSFQALENCLPSTTQSVDEKELQIVWFRFDFTSKLFQALEQFLPSTAQRKNNSSYTVAIRFKFNFNVNEVFQPLKNFLLSTTQPVKNHLIQVFSFGFDFTSKSFQALENCLLATTQSVAEKELQIVWFRFDFTSKLFQALEKFLPSTAQRKNNSSHSVSIRFNCNGATYAIFQHLNIFLLSTTQPVKNHLIQVFSFRFDFAPKSFQMKNFFLSTTQSVSESKNFKSFGFHSIFGEIFRLRNEKTM